jgi:predicted N-formylglutamate amidohydrolase
LKPRKKQTTDVKNPRILITCEHADLRVPKFIKSEFPNKYQQMLQSQAHQTYDKYALQASAFIQDNLKKKNIAADLIHYDYTRLIIDANRTPENKGYHSKLSSFLTSTELKKTEALYLNYVHQCQSWIKKNLAKGPIFIFSVHSFTPVYKNKLRPTDIGLLFRNKIIKEKHLAQTLRKNISSSNDALKTHFNLPYRGSTDCFLNWILDLHKENDNFNGLFFEFNQNYLKKGLKQKMQKLTQSLMQTFETL